MRGLCYENLGQDNLAIKDYNTLLEIDKKNTLGLFYLGLINAKINKFKEAINYYNKALISKQISSSWDSTKTEIIFDKTNFYEENYDVPMTQIFYERGLAYYSNRQNTKAFYDFQFCIKRSYMIRECYYMTGLCWLNGNNKEKACEAFHAGAFYGDSLSKEEIKISCN